MVFDDLAGQDEPDAGAVRLGREERHPKIVGPREPGAVVFDLDDDGVAVVTPAMSRPGSDPSARLIAVAVPPTLRADKVPLT